MKLERGHKVVMVVLAVAAFMIIENVAFVPEGVFRYSGIQIYDVVRDLRSLESNGFDITVNVQGTSAGKAVDLTGKAAEIYTGWFLLKSGETYRIIEGPMGSKDVLASAIHFDVSPAVSVEAVYPPERGPLRLKEGFRKVRGSIAFDGASITPTVLQQARNANEEFYSLLPGRIDVIPYGSGFILDVKVPVDVEDLSLLLSGINASSVQTGHMYYYASADDESDAQSIRESLQASGAILVNYYTQR
ncbi:MAG: hypothetical protein V1813_03250 [Candidatus Aenigmatarchaeota archaeon]